MTIYVLNTLVIPIDFERFPKVTVKIRKASIEEVRQMLSRGFVSAIGHQATATLLSQLLGIEVPFNRVTVKAEPGDILIHFVLRERIPEGKILTLEELQRLPFDFAITEVLEA
ncbi:MAG: STIV orfB116 family protein [Candidatus Caldarchaeales archaeon]|jgi:urate oxidase